MICRMEYPSLRSARAITRRAAGVMSPCFGASMVPAPAQIGHVRFIFMLYTYTQFVLTSKRGFFMFTASHEINSRHRPAPDRSNAKRGLDDVLRNQSRTRP